MWIKNISHIVDKLSNLLPIFSSSKSVISKFKPIIFSGFLDFQVKLTKTYGEIIKLTCYKIGKRNKIL